MSALPSSAGPEPHLENLDFYRGVLETLSASGLPFLVGGAYALNHYTGIGRQTRDLDLFVRRRDYEAVVEALRPAGYEAELTFPHWLGKVHAGNTYIDLIFSSGNGVAEVDDAWFEHADVATLAGITVKINPPEEMIWSKSFVMERERFDGADVAHLLLACGDRLDWPRLMRRFDAHWRVLMSHLILFGFVYPGQRNRIPAWVMDELLERLRQETHAPPPQDDVCGGTLLSREQYLFDLGMAAMQDGRAKPFGNMSEKDIAHWTSAIQDGEAKH